MRKLGVNICRFVVALTFIFSGYVKAIDPLGTQYKIKDYLAAPHLAQYVPDIVTLATSVLLSALEFCMGVCLLLAIHRRKTTKVAVAFMVVMALISLWLWLANPISDCGCFGDAIVLTNGQTLLKNVLLLLFCLVLAAWPLKMVRFISRSNQWIAMNYTVIFVLVSSLWCLYDLPFYDFRPYHLGANIKQGMEIPEGAPQPEFATTFILEKNGERREFTLDNYPDSTWTFIDQKTVQTKAGYVPPIHDFTIQTIDNGADITEEILTDTGYVFLLVSPHLENADDTNFGEIDQIYEYAQTHNYPFYCLTASGDKAINVWRDLTGAEYTFCNTDEITLKTIIRSNPGLLLLKGGTVVGKWSHNRLPKLDSDTPDLAHTEYATFDSHSVVKTLIMLLCWFVLPLLILIMADRLWAWSKWLRRIRAVNHWRKAKRKQTANNETTNN